jgi:hypothetical protein
LILAAAASVAMISKYVLSCSIWIICFGICF